MIGIFSRCFSLGYFFILFLGLLSFDAYSSAGVERRVLFVGNSLTQHLPSGKIGWSGSWGMAASAIDKDYVHVTLKQVIDQGHPVRAELLNLAVYEKQEFGGTELGHFPGKFDFLVVQLGDNVVGSSEGLELFRSNYVKIVDSSKRMYGVKNLICLGSWRRNRIVDDIISGVCLKKGGTYVPISDISEQEGSLADASGVRLNYFVGRHPSDLGMQRIASRISGELARTLK